MKHYTLSYMEDGEIKMLHFEVTRDKEEQFFQAMSNPICRQMFEYGKGKITAWQLEEGKPTDAYTQYNTLKHIKPIE